MNIPICFHPPARPQQPQVSKDRFEGHLNQALSVNPLRNPIEQILAVSAFTAGGVRERFPRLKVAFLKATAAGCRGCFIASMSTGRCRARWR